MPSSGWNAANLVSPAPAGASSPGRRRTTTINPPRDLSRAVARQLRRGRHPLRIPLIPGKRTWTATIATPPPTPILGATGPLSPPISTIGMARPLPQVMTNRLMSGGRPPAAPILDMTGLLPPPMSIIAVAGQLPLMTIRAVDVVPAAPIPGARGRPPTMANRGRGDGAAGLGGGARKGLRRTVRVKGIPASPVVPGVGDVVGATDMVRSNRCPAVVKMPRPRKSACACSPTAIAAAPNSRIVWPPKDTAPRWRIES